MTYTFSAEADLLCRAEVVVVGGGTAGTIAAIAAAREGKRVVLVEAMGALGGTAALGLVTPTMSTHVAGEPQNSYLAAMLDNAAAAHGAMVLRGNSRYYDPLLLSAVSEEMAVQSGVSVYLYTRLIGVRMENNRICGIFVCDKAGVHEIDGDVFIDATGDGDLSVMAGASYTKGNPKTGKNQPISLRYIVGGVDEAAFHETAPDSISYDNGQLYAYCVVQNGPRSIEKIFTAAKDAGDLTAEDLAYWQIFSLPNRPHCIACNCPEIFDAVDGTAPADLTNAQLVGKQAIERHMRFYKKYFRGFENSYIAEIAPMVGIRESREIICEHVLTVAEAAQYRKFEDAVAQTNYPIDIHGFGDAYSDKPVGNGDNEKPYFEIPFRSLIVKGIDNLLVCGRCIGADFFVEASIRIIPTCRATGEAAGIGAALALSGSGILRETDGACVRARMEACGAVFAK